MAADKLALSEDERSGKVCSDPDGAKKWLPSEMNLELNIGNVKCEATAQGKFPPLTSGVPISFGRVFEAGDRKHFARQSPF